MLHDKFEEHNERSKRG